MGAQFTAGAACYGASPSANGPTGLPFTFQVWAFAATFTSGWQLFNIAPASVVSGENYTIVSNGPIMTATRHLVGNVNTSNNLNNGAWNHICLKSEGSAFTWWLNGTKSTANISGSNTGFTRFGIGGFFDGSTGANAGNWTLAEFALWDAALTDADAAELYAGRNPRRVKPANLKSYNRMAGGLTRPDGGFYNLTAYGTAPTSSANHPRVYP